MAVQAALVFAAAAYASRSGAASHTAPCRIMQAQCYSDALGARTLPVGITVGPSDPHHDDMTAEVCASMCAVRGLPLCGVELGVQCFAGKAVNSGSHTKPVSACSTPCSGNHSASCGGDWAMLVFKYSGDCQAPPPAPPPPHGPPQPWQDAALAFEARAADLVARLNESQLIGLTAGPKTAAIEVNGVKIPATNLGSECLAGFSPPPGHHTTAFPHTVNLGNMFDPALVRRVGSAIGDEARAALNAGLRGEMPPQFAGQADCLSPVLNVARDPRWGRSYESFGEDPTAVGINGAAYLRGLQNGAEPELQEHGKYIKIAAIAKHLGAYSLECYNTNGSDHSRGCAISRQSFNAIVDPMDLQESYMRPWRLAGKAGLTGAMCSYNAINGRPACADGSMLTAMLKDELGVKGYVIGDDDAVEKIFDMADGGHFYAKNVVQAGADALNAGVDVDYGHVFAPHMATAIQSGMTTIGKLRAAAARALYPRFATGCFDALNATRFSGIPLSVLNGPSNIALAKEAALGSIVLLKHRGGHLPIKSGLKVGVFGAAATDTSKQVNRYTGSPAHVVSILEGMQNRSSAGAVADFTKLEGTHSGCEQAAEAAKGLGIAVVVIATGNSPGEPMGTWSEGEMNDREKIGIPPEDLALLEAVAASNTPTVCIAVSGGPMALGPAVDNTNVVAVIGAFTSGEQGGAALAELIYGDQDFSGRLAATMYNADFAKASDFTDMSMRAYPGRGHRYLQDESLQLFGFGFGLALTPWSYSSPTLAGPATIAAAALAAGNTLNFSTTVRNPAATDRKTAVIALLSRTDAPPAAEGWPKQWLLDFVKPSVVAAATATITFAIDEASVSRWDEKLKSFAIRPGNYKAWVVDGVGEVMFAVTA